MKAKHLLFSSIFLSMGFAACTNEVEEFAAQSQVKDFPGVELGEDFVINVTNSEFAADAETRAQIAKDGIDWIASWDKCDTIGAAWFSKFVYAEDGKTVATAKDVYDGLEEYGSNSAFVHQEGSTFKSEATSKLGAYVLYYPYNLKITDDMKEIPVKEIPANQQFDTKDVTAQVTKNMTAANVAVFGESGVNAPRFTVEQIPNLYELSFHIQDKYLMTLDQDVKVTHVMVEADDNAEIFHTSGIIKPDYTDITVETYNALPSAPAMPEIIFEGRNTANRIIIDIENADDETYYIKDTGKDNGTGKFYFSLLPTKPITNNVTFKIVGKVGNKTKVFARTVNLTEAHKAEGGFAWKMSNQGQHINLAVTLDNETEDEGIYSPDQFIEYWESEATVFDIKVPGLTLTSDMVDFNLPADKKVTFKGLPITLPAVSGAYTFESDVTINGNATLLEGTTSDNVNVIVNGDLTANNYTFGGNVTVNAVEGVKNSGKFTSYENVTFKKNGLKAAGAVNVESGILTLKKTEVGGAVNVKKGAQLKASSGIAIASSLTISAGSEATLAGTWSAKSVSVSGKLTFSGTATISSNGKAGKFDVKNGATIVNTSGTIREVGAFTVASGANPVEIMAIVEKMGAITANEPVQINTKKNDKLVKTIINGDITANAAVTFGDKVIIQEAGNVIANADVTFNGEIPTTAEEFKGIGNIYGIVDGAIVATTGKVNFAKVAKTGDINAGAKVVFAADATTGDINAAADVEFNGAANTGNITATTGKVKFLNGDKKATTGAIITATEMEFNGEAVTGDVTATNVPVTFKKAATVEDLTATGEKAIITFTDVNFSKTVDSNTSYFDVTLSKEAQLIADNIQAAGVVKVFDQYSKLVVNNSIIKANELQAYGNADVNVQAASAIEKMTIEPGVTVTLTGAEAMTIGNLTTIKKGDYEGTLLTNTTNGVTVNGGKNEGKIAGTAILTVNGMFTQNGEFTPKSVTVGKDGDFTVAKSMTATITNNGHVTVDKKQNAKVTNKGTLNVEPEASATVSNSGTTTVADGATMTLSAKNTGTINVVNGAIIKPGSNATNKVVYAWEGEENQPTGDILNFISQIDFYNATIKPAQVLDCTALQVINVSGTLKTDATFDWNSLSLLEINAVAKGNEKVVTFKGTKSKIVATANITVKENVTLDTDDNVTFKNSAITLESGASFAGKKDATVTVKM